jgi:hypothetical protein
MWFDAVVPPRRHPAIMNLPALLGDKRLLAALSREYELLKATNCEQQED